MAYLPTSLIRCFLATRMPVHDVLSKASHSQRHRRAPSLRQVRLPGCWAIKGLQRTCRRQICTFGWVCGLASHIAPHSNSCHYRESTGRKSCRLVQCQLIYVHLHQNYHVDGFHRQRHVIGLGLAEIAAMTGFRGGSPTVGIIKRSNHFPWASITRWFKYK